MKANEGYAPDMFSEHARLAQFGARVLSTLAQPRTCHEHLAAIAAAAADLGLIDAIMSFAPNPDAPRPEEN